MQLEGRRFLVAGLGESGLAMTKWLVRQGAEVRVADSRANPPNLAALQAFAPQVEVVRGEFAAPTFAGFDAIALSPGVPPSTPAIAEAGIPIVSEVDLFVAAWDRYCPDTRVAAITGSNGKTTVTALTAHLLNGAGLRAVACGNISPSLLDALMQAVDARSLPDVWVCELSSFQLECTRYLPADAATVLNVTADHLDRHATLFDYANAKARIFHGAVTQILNRDDDWSLGMGRCVGLTTFGLGPPPREGHYGIRKNAIYLGDERLVALSSLPIEGRHNAANVMAALALCRALDVPAEKALPALKKFRGLPHRVEPVAEIGGVLYVDDSKGTNVGATLAAIAGMGRPVAVILGGDGKGQEFSPLRAALKEHGRAVALIGRDAGRIGKAIEGCGLPTRTFPTLEEAVAWLAGEAGPGDCVLLSPACASWDMFKDYAERAEVFRQAVAAREEKA
ncbi:MAG: UDP-N-acetylmuramoyl-L-alanine--D-glutamate ligase [Zoogloeaceae bacterium]|nr:UDP-N-acetylmuramoyl-L-alanine--D-glutamate ligase [Zoogloeaceae bacterium]